MIENAKLLITNVQSTIKIILNPHSLRSRFFLYLVYYYDLNNTTLKDKLRTTAPYVFKLCIRLNDFCDNYVVNYENNRLKHVYYYKLTIKTDYAYVDSWKHHKTVATRNNFHNHTRLSVDLMF